MGEVTPQKEPQSLTSADRIRQLNEVDEVRRPTQLMRRTVINIYPGRYSTNSFRWTCNPGSNQRQTGLLPRTRRIFRLAQDAVQRSDSSIFRASVLN